MKDELRQFALKVKKLRDKQKLYFRFRDKKLLEECRDLEQGIDAYMTEISPETMMKFGHIVSDMRAFQKIYFRTFSYEAKDKAMALERAVDEEVNKILNPNTQINLF